MRFLGVVLALAFVVVGIAPTSASAQNQLEAGKNLTVGTRQVSDWWMKVDYEPRDARRGEPGGGGELPPGIERDVDTATIAAPTNGAVDPGSEMQIETRKAGDFQFDVKQQGAKTTGDLPPGIERDTDASGTAVSQGIDLLGAEHHVRARADLDQKKPVLRPAYDRAAPVSMGSGRATPRENAVRGVRGYEANRWE